MVYWKSPPAPKLPANDVSLRRMIRSREAELPTAGKTPYAAKVSCLAQIAAESVDWLWGNVIPLGKVTTLTGDAGVGKTFFTLDATAEVTRGHGTSQQCQHENPGNVLLISSENDLADVAGPRLKQAGADLLRVHALRGVTRQNPAADDQACWLFQLHEDLKLLELEVARQKAAGLPLRLIIIDPFPAELFSGPHGAQKLAPTIKHLAEIAAWSQTAILLVATSVPGQDSASNLLKGLEAAVHTAWTIVKDFDRPERRLLLPVKSNLTENPPGLSFRIQDNGLIWEPDPVRLTAQHFQAEALERTRTPLFQMEWSELARATDWLQEYLKGKVLPLKIIRQEAATNDISYRTLHRAFCGLRGVARRVENSRLWEWSLPDGPMPNLPYGVVSDNDLIAKIRGVDAS